MQGRTQQQAGGVPVSPAMEPGTRSVARGRRRMASLAITAAAVCAALVILALTFSLRGTPAVRTTHPAAVPPAGVSNAETVRSDRLHRALGWVDGLAVGLILPSEVTSRLRVQDPSLARTVMAAWSDLNSSGSSIRLQRALGWVDGLAAGLILPSDVTSRLEAQDPRMAKVVMATWSDLNAMAASD